MASVFELFSACLFSDCLLVGKFSNFFVQYKAAGVRKNVVRMIFAVNSFHSTRRYIGTGIRGASVFTFSVSELSVHFVI